MKHRLVGPGLGGVPVVIILAASAIMLGGCGILFQDHEKRADATLQPSAGNPTRGSVTLIERSDGVQVTYNLSGMPPDSDHALQIHERGDCIVSNVTDTGPVFAPAAERTTAGSKKEGDLANIHADANGLGHRLHCGARRIARWRALRAFARNHSSPRRRGSLCRDSPWRGAFARVRRDSSVVRPWFVLSPLQSPVSNVTGVHTPSIPGQMANVHASGVARPAHLVK